MNLSINQKEEIQSALSILRNGGVILYPTDTIWGLGCDASNSEAINRLYQIKERDKDKPLLVLLEKKEKLKKYFASIPAISQSLLEEAVEPRTIIYPKAINLPENLLAEDGSLGIRIVNHPFCTPLIQELGNPLTSTSANFSGEKSPANYEEISKELLAKVDYVVNPKLFSSGRDVASAIYKVLNDTKVICLRE